MILVMCKTQSPNVRIVVDIILKNTSKSRYSDIEIKIHHISFINYSTMQFINNGYIICI